MFKKELKKIFLIITILFIFLTVNYEYTYSKAYDSKRVFMVILNKVTFDELIELRNINKLIDEGSIGLMNPRGTGRYDGAEGYITINTSSRAYANDKSSSCFDVKLKEEKSNEYFIRTGKEVMNERIVNIEINLLKKLNENNNYMPHIGALGDNLHKAGLKTAVFGNSDTADSFIRANCLIAIDSRGLVDYGNIDDVLINDLTYPYGIRTDYDRILKEIIKLLNNPKIAFFVIEEGDLNRLYKYGDNLPEERVEYYKTEILKNVDRFIGELISIVGYDNTRIIILSPNSINTDKIKNGLSPVIIWGDDVKKGVVTSSTTHRKGIIANLDIAPSITEYLGAISDNFTGHSVKYIYVDNNTQYINALNERVNFISSIRYPILSIYCIATIIVLIITLCVILFNLKLNKNYFNILCATLLVILYVPLFFLLISVIVITDIKTYIFFLVLFLALLVVALYKIKDYMGIGLITGLLYILILIDILRGGSLVKYSVLGYDPIIGARYYGIGNELVGVLLPTSILFISYVFDCCNRRYYYFYVALLVCTIILTIHPNYGANLGGTVSLIIAYTYFIFRTLDKHIELKKLTIILFSAIVIVLLISIADAYLNPNPSHLGSVLLKVVENGYYVLYDVIVRKVSMNIRLISMTTWYKVLFITIIIILMIVSIRKKYLSKVFSANKYILIGLTSSILGSLVGFFVNDSGVLLSAISNIYNCIVLMYLVIKEFCS